jgi:hypothetical protein
MSKKLKLAFWLTDKTLDMKIVEQTGLPHLKETGFVRIKASPYLEDWGIYLRGNYWAADNDVVSKCFNSNEERDEYLDKVVNAITDELFVADEKLEFNKPCKVDNNTTTGKFELAIYLGKLRLNDRWYHITKPFDEDSSNPTMLKAWSVVSPVKTCRGPIKEEFGPVVTYTWEKIYGSYDSNEIM